MLQAGYQGNMRYLPMVFDTTVQKCTKNTSKTLENKFCKTGVERRGFYTFDNSTVGNVQDVSKKS